MDIHQSKKYQRMYAKKYWNEFLESNESKLLIKNFIDWTNSLPKNRIFAFYPITGEPQIFSFIVEQFESIYLPVILPDNNMVFMLYKNKNEFCSVKKNNYGIIEPIIDFSINSTKEKMKYIQIPKEKDIILIPSLGCNYEYIRLGRGGGFYDRYFEKNPISKKSLKISLIPEKLKNLNFKKEKHDINLDIIITEKNIVYK